MTPTRSRPASTLLPTLAVLAGALVFMTTFADRDGYEGDDLNSIVPMAHLSAAKQGLLLIYRYAWQPLSYEIGAAAWRLAGTPTAVFMLAPICGAIALALIFAQTWHEAGRRWMVTIVALLAVPEIVYSSLYYNSTIMGLPLEALAVLLLRRRGDHAAIIVAGLATGLAVLMRMDFILICPLLAMMAWWRARRLGPPILLAGVVMAVLGMGIIAGIFQPAEVVRIQQESTAEIIARWDQPGWDMRLRIGVITVLLSPIGWLLLASSPLVMVEAWRRQGWPALLWIAAAFPAVYPIGTITTPKYELPLMAVLPLLFIRTQDALLGRAATRAGALRIGLSALAIVPVFVSLSLYGHAPFVRVGLRADRPVGTHDGYRAYGGYVWQMAATDASDARISAQVDAETLADRLLMSGQSLAIVGGENYFDRGGVGWRHLQLLLERKGVHGRVMSPHTLQFDTGRARLILTTDRARAVASGLTIVDLPGPSD